jgi:hypothetical protein
MTLLPYGKNVGSLGAIVSYDDPAPFKASSVKINDVACTLLVLPFPGQ